MKDDRKTKKQLLDEMNELRQSIQKLRNSQGIEKPDLNAEMARQILYSKGEEESNFYFYKVLLSNLMDNLPDHIYFKDKQSRFLSINKGMAKHFGLSKPEEAFGKNDFDFFTAEHANQAYQDEQKILETGRPIVNIEEKETWSNKEETWALTSKMPLLDNDGQIIGTFGLSRDITEKKRAENELHKKTLQQSKLLETVRQLNASLEIKQVLTQIGKGAKDIIDAHGCVIYMLDSDDKVLTPVVALEPPYEEAILSEKLDVDKSLTGKAVKRKRGFIFNNANQLPFSHRIAGTPDYPTEHVIVAPFLSDDTVMGAMCLNRLEAKFTKVDLAWAQAFATFAATALKNAQTYQELQREAAERRRVLNQYKESENKFRVLFEHSPDAIVLIDPKNSAVSWPIIDCNESFCQMNGFSRQELIGQSIDIVHGKHEKSGNRKQYFNRLKKEGTITLETEHTRKEGTVIQIQTSSTLIWVDGRELVLGIDRDITEIKNAALEREQLLASEHQQRIVAETMREVVIALTSHVDYEAVLDEILNQVQKIVKHDAANIMLVDNGCLKMSRTLSQDHTAIPKSVSNKVYVLSDLPLQQNVIETRTPVVINDTLMEEKWIAGEDRKWVRSFISIPLCLHEYVFGILQLESKTPDSFSYQNISQLQPLANGAAIALGNAQLFTSIRHQAEHLDLLRKVSKDLIDIRDLDRLLHQIAGRALQLLHGDAGGIYLMQPDTEELEWVVSIGKDVAQIGTRLKKGEGVSGKVWETGQPIIINDYEKSEWSSVGTSVLGVPISWRDEFMGVICIHISESEKRHYTMSDADLLSEFATQAAIAIKNARLYEQAQRELAERRQAEKALAQERNLLHSLMNNMPEYIIFKDKNSRYIRTNKAHAQQLLGIDDPAEVVGKSDLDLFPENEAKRYLNEEQIIIKTRTPVVGREWQVTSRTTGKTVWLSESKIPIQSDTREVMGFVGISRDVTEQRIARMKLERHALVQSALKQISEALLHESKINDISESIRLQCTKLTQSQIGCMTYLHPKNGELVIPALTMSDVSGNNADVEKDFKQDIWKVWSNISDSKQAVICNDLSDPFCSDILTGQVSICHFLAAPSIYSGQLLGMIVMANSETEYTKEHLSIVEQFAALFALAIHREREKEERNLLQAQLIQAQKLEAVGTLAGGIAHDFNNLLTGIIGGSQLLLMNQSKDTTESRILQQIEESGRRAAELTSQLLTFSRQRPPVKKPTDVNKVVAKMSRLLQRSIPSTIQLQVITDNSIPIIEADEGQIRQVLLNLGVNARDAMPDGGKLTFKTKLAHENEIDVPPNLLIKTEYYVSVSSSDTGIGMDPDMQQRIFEPFFTTKAEGKGTGLGLAIVYGIIENHSGWIEVFSTPNKGSMFTFYLPVIEVQPERNMDRHTMEITMGTETILLVDDDETVTYVGKGILERCGYNVLKAENGKDALDMLNNHNGEIKLIITDLVMPLMGGKELLKKLKELNIDVPIILTSGYSMKKTAEEIKEEGFSEFIAKPFKIEDMALTVRNVLDQHLNGIF